MDLLGCARVLLALASTTDSKRIQVAVERTAKVAKL
jgi:hypothetical protein